ncbi:sulfatase [Pelagicoccus mobilis]|uniref:Sulfatase n=1 Tax=Pelagicoccus mobilis TaxID=415221 RepID=A0A934VTG3_9BACT|nr:sulfatase [Pelagicoccus mobilis]MBK1880040.1 sulfatase [Pelagicoccus mobilis]
MFCTSAIAVAADSGSNAGSDDSRPSILFLNIDDWNDWNSVLGGHPQATTPNLERFAARSVTFTRAICSSPVCFPSRTSIFSGLHPARTGAKSNPNGGRPWRSYISDAITLPKLLSGHGWKSIGIGKNFHNRDEAEFDEYTRRGREPKPIPETYRDLNPSGRWGVASVPTHQMPDYVSVSKGVEALEANREGLFLSLGIYRPHVPWVVPQEYFDRHPLENLVMPETREDDLDDLAERFKTMARNPAKFGPGYHEALEAKGFDREKVQAYLACVSFADDQVGRILDAWYASPHAEKGYVVLWSDHGYQLSEKEGWSKMKPWYDSARVNLMIAGPGLAKGERCDKAVSLLDLFPTLIDLLELPEPPQSLDGNSLVALLKNPQADWEKPVLMSSEEEGIRYDVVLSNDYRMTRFATGETELYHLDSDPHEFTNLSEDSEYKTVIEELSKHLSLKHAEPDAEGWLEAEDLPHQTSSDSGQRGNYHYPEERVDASEGKAVCAALIKGPGSYIEFVIKIDRPREYDLSIELAAEGSCTLSTAAVVDDAKQADAGFPMKPLMDIEPIRQSESFDLVSAGVVRFDQAGLHLLRFSSRVPKQQLKIDRIRLLNRN